MQLETVVVMALDIASTESTDQTMPYTWAKCFKATTEFLTLVQDSKNKESAEQVLTSAVGREGSALPDGGSQGLSSSSSCGL